jgi:hypothetical protein
MRKLRDIIFDQVPICKALDWLFCCPKAISDFQIPATIQRDFGVSSEMLKSQLADVADSFWTMAACSGFISSSLSSFLDRYGPSKKSHLLTSVFAAVCEMGSCLYRLRHQLVAAQNMTQ